jgi:hypothetical protein
MPAIGHRGRDACSALDQVHGAQLAPAITWNRKIWHFASRDSATDNQGLPRTEKKAAETAGRGESAAISPDQ